MDFASNAGIAKNVVELHGDILDFESDAHKGTTYTFELPEVRSIHVS